MTRLSGCFVRVDGFLPFLKYKVLPEVADKVNWLHVTKFKAPRPKIYLLVEDPQTAGSYIGLPIRADTNPERDLIKSLKISQGSTNATQLVEINNVPTHYTHTQSSSRR